MIHYAKISFLRKSLCPAVTIKTLITMMTNKAIITILKSIIQKLKKVHEKTFLRNANWKNSGRIYLAPRRVVYYEPLNVPKTFTYVT